MTPTLSGRRSTEHAACRCRLRSVQDLKFEVATERDWPGIWAVLTEVVRTGDTYMYPPEISEAEMRRAWMPSDFEPRRIVYVAREGHEIVGTAYLRPNMPGLGDHVANAGWAVSANRRGRGVGRSFAAFVIADARARGYQAMQFNAVVASNTGAVLLWESLGFRFIGTVPSAFRHRTLGNTAVHVMWKEL
jgi:L-amino acid N-acyltransferase YncA